MLYHYTKSHEAVLTLIQVSCRLASTHVSVHYCKCTLTSIFDIYVLIYLRRAFCFHLLFHFIPWYCTPVKFLGFESFLFQILQCKRNLLQAEPTHYHRYRVTKEPKDLFLLHHKFRMLLGLRHQVLPNYRLLNVLVT